MSRAAVETKAPVHGFVITKAAQSFGWNFWGKKMTKNPVLIYLAQWGGSLAVLSVAAFASALSGNLDLPERAPIANDRFGVAPAEVVESHAAMTCARGADGGNREIHYVMKANPRGALADMNPNAACEPSSSERH
jgi:hypothetical protein